MITRVVGVCHGANSVSTAVCSATLIVFRAWSFEAYRYHENDSFGTPKMAKYTDKRKNIPTASLTFKRVKNRGSLSAHPALVPLVMRLVDGKVVDAPDGRNQLHDVNTAFFMAHRRKCR